MHNKWPENHVLNWHLLPLYYTSIQAVSHKHQYKHCLPHTTIKAWSPTHYKHWLPYTAIQALSCTQTTSLFLIHKTNIISHKYVLSLIHTALPRASLTHTELPTVSLSNTATNIISLNGRGPVWGAPPSITWPGPASWPLSHRPAVSTFWPQILQPPHPES